MSRHSGAAQALLAAVSARLVAAVGIAGLNTWRYNEFLSTRESTNLLPEPPAEICMS